MGPRLKALLVALIVVMLTATSCAVPPSPPELIVTLQANLSGINSAGRADVLQRMAEIVQKRLVYRGVLTFAVEKMAPNRIAVRLPAADVDVKEMAALVTQTGLLDFREQVSTSSGPQWKIATGTVVATDKELTGVYLKPNSAVIYDPKTWKPSVAFEFDTQGAAFFEQITARNLGKPLGIFLDGQMISSPIVQAVISEGRGVVTSLTVAEAKMLMAVINGGMLPVPLTVVGASEYVATPAPSTVDHRTPPTSAQ